MIAFSSATLVFSKSILYNRLNFSCFSIKMITLKEYEIYLKVKKFIETEGCDENKLIPKLVNGVGILPAYVPLIICLDDTEPTKYYSVSTAARDCEISKQTIASAYKIGVRE